MLKATKRALPGPTPEEKQDQLERILSSHVFHGAETLKSFLRFVVKKSLEGQQSELKEYTIATEVFGRSENYDPRIDSLVRVQAARLRAKLEEYYTSDGDGDKVLIRLPKGLSLLKTPSALWALKLTSDGTIFQESCVDSSFPFSIRFPAGFELEPDCIWRSSLFGISLAPCNGKFLRVPD